MCDCERHEDGTKKHCGEDCDYVKRMEAGMQEMISVIHRMEKSVAVAKTMIIGLTDENVRLTKAIQDRCAVDRMKGKFRA